MIKLERIIPVPQSLQNVKIHTRTLKLVGGFNPVEKILVQLDHFPKNRGENKNI